MPANESIPPVEALQSRRARVRSAGLALGAVLIFLSCSQDTESQLAEIRSLQDAGQFEASIAPLRKLMADDSGSPEGNYRLGIALVRTGRSSLAVWPLRKASQSDEYGVQAGLILGSTLQSNDSLAESIRAYSNVIRLEPENLAALTARGTAQLGAGFPELALADADRLLELRPDDQNATLLRAGALMDLRRHQEAEDSLASLAQRAAESDDPNDAGRKCTALAVFYRSREDSTRARETFKGCLEKYPTHPVVQQYASDFFVDSENPSKAIMIWRDAVAATPEDLRLRGKLAAILTEQGRADEAEAIYQVAIELFDTAEAWQMLANFHRDRANPAKAREALEEAMQRTRQVSPAARFGLADLLIQEGNLERARQIAESLSEPAYKHMLRGSILLEMEQPARALEEFEAGLKYWPNNAGGRYLAGRAAFELGDRTRALAEYREAIRSGIADTDAALRTAEINYQMGHFGLAAQFAERQIQHRPDPEGRAHVIAARSAVALGSPSQAEAILSRLKARLPEDATAYVEFAGLVRKQKGPAAALEVILSSNLDLTEIAHINATRAVIFDQLALDQVSQARQTLDSALAANPDSAPTQHLLGQFLLLTDQPEKALAAFDAVLAGEPEHAPSLAAKAELLRDQGDLAGARQLFEQAVGAAPRSGDYLYLLGQIDLIEGDERAAEGRFREALKADPSIVGANNDLAWILASSGRNLELALELATRAVNRDSNADTLDTLGYVHLKSGDADEAASTLSKALEARPDSGPIRYRLGAALAAKGETDQARQVLTRALESPPFPEAEEARKELARLQGS